MPITKTGAIQSPSTTAIAIAKNRFAYTAPRQRALIAREVAHIPHNALSTKEIAELISQYVCTPLEESEIFTTARLLSQYSWSTGNESVNLELVESLRIHLGQLALSPAGSAENAIHGSWQRLTSLQTQLLSFEAYMKKRNIQLPANKAFIDQVEAFSYRFLLFNLDPRYISKAEISELFLTHDPNWVQEIIKFENVVFPFFAQHRDPLYQESVQKKEEAGAFLLGRAIEIRLSLQGYVFSQSFENTALMHCERCSARVIAHPINTMDSDGLINTHQSSCLFLRGFLAKRIEEQAAAAKHVELTADRVTIETEIVRLQRRLAELNNQAKQAGQQARLTYERQQENSRGGVGGAAADL